MSQSGLHLPVALLPFAARAARLDDDVPLWVEDEPWPERDAREPVRRPARDRARLLLLGALPPQLVVVHLLVGVDLVGVDPRRERCWSARSSDPPRTENCAEDVHAGWTVAWEGCTSETIKLRDGSPCRLQSGVMTSFSSGFRRPPSACGQRVSSP